MITSIFALIILLFFNSILSVALVDKFNVDPSYIGYLFAMACFVYTISSVIVYKLCIDIDGRYQ